MSNSVLSRTLKQCRRALLGGSPILYIKTDSDIFIRNLLLDEASPLVVLLSNGGCVGTQEERDLKMLRPIYELSDPRDKQLKFCKNYKDTYPDLGISGIYNELYASPADALHSRMIGPFVWSYKMPDDPKELQRVFKALERYVADHENPNHTQYKVLKNCVVVLYSSNVMLSPMLQPYTEIIDVEYPDEEEIREIIKAESGGDPALIGNDEYLSALCSDFLGFTTEEVIMTMNKILSISSLERSAEVESIISDHKKQKLQGGMIEQCSSDSNIGGMKNYRVWLEDQVKPLKNTNLFMRKTGTPPPKGVLLCGIPGCGKSEAAKFTAQMLKVPLLKMDIGSLMDKYQGVSEQKMRDALRMAEAMSPCVLWIDELEKGFSGAGTDGDSSSFKRMFGYMLGWMQDNQKPCFIFATANDIGGLPKEFFRSGRFDALYAVYLPTADECCSIFAASMDRAVKTIGKKRGYEVNTLTDSPADPGGEEKLWKLRQRVGLFSEECYTDKEMYITLLDDFFVTENVRPRIVVGSDIQKIVNLALRELSEEGRITKPLWENALQKVIKMPTLNVYGDGEENVDSIAVAYCRMLRKGFIPTSADVLFKQEDYHVENVEEYDRLKRLSTSSMSEGEMKEYKEKLASCEILKKNEPPLKSRYDRAVYRYLRDRINAVAWLLEKHERESMILR